jgi:hypothetical protein
VFMTVLFLFLVGCGATNISDRISEKYPLDDVVKSSTNADDTARVFLAKDQSISEVSSSIQKEVKPENSSEIKDKKQVLVYDEYFVTLTEDEENPENTVIEVATTGFVRDNYRPSFFDGLLAYYILDNIFDVDDWGRKQSKRCGGSCYGGYSKSGGHYKGPTIPSTFRGSGNRGGGPGTGK